MNQSKVTQLTKTKNDYSISRKAQKYMIPQIFMKNQCFKRSLEIKVTKVDQNCRNNQL